MIRSRQSDGDSAVHVDRGREESRFLRYLRGGENERTREAGRDEATKGETKDEVR